jgi:oligopeptide/dipeptide ABC transporter ATP-binding protein
VTLPIAPPPLLEVRDLVKTFGGGLLGGPRVAAVDGVSFEVARGEAVALVGESGSGKSTIARLLVRLARPDAGAIALEGEDALAGRAALPFRARIQMVFQDPFGSLNPVHRVAHHLERPLLRHGKARPAEARARALALLSAVGLEPAADFVDRYPHELSGGQRQRVAIARALAVEPDVLVADEPTSMLDVSIRSGVLALLERLKRERRLAIVLITHDLAAARLLADRILVLYRGRIVEAGPSRQVIRAPLHPYARTLVAALGEVAPPRPARPDAGPGGCAFAARCPDAVDRCLAEEPAPRELGPGRTVRCHLAGTTGAAAAS